MEAQYTAVPSAPANRYAPPRASVRDVVAPQASAEPAERSTRLGANILDSLVFGGMVLTPLVLMMVTRIVGPDNADVVGALGVALMLAGFVAWCWLTILYMHRNGQSIGKKLAGIKVVRSDGTPVSLGRLIMLRNVVNAMLGILPLYGLIDALFIFGDARQCLHDKLADTIVVVA
jgi:uncharacterized RDD family membrane protein YckC